MEERVQRICASFYSAARIHARARVLWPPEFFRFGKHGILSFDLRLAANPFDLSAPRCPTRSAKRTSVFGYSWFSFEGGSIGSKAAHSQSSRAHLRGTSSGGTSQQRYTSGARQYDSCTIGAHTFDMSDSETPLGRGAGGAHSSKKKKKAQQAALAAQQAPKPMSANICSENTSLAPRWKHAR